MGSGGMAVVVVGYTNNSPISQILQS